MSKSKSKKRSKKYLVENDDKPAFSVNYDTLIVGPKLWRVVKELIPDIEERNMFLGVHHIVKGKK